MTNEDFHLRRGHQTLLEAEQRFEQRISERDATYQKTVAERQAEHDAAVKAGQLDYFFKDSLKLYADLHYEAKHE